MYFVWHKVNVRTHEDNVSTIVREVATSFWLDAELFTSPSDLYTTAIKLNWQWLVLGLHVF